MHHPVLRLRRPHQGSMEKRPLGVAERTGGDGQKEKLQVVLKYVVEELDGGAVGNVRLLAMI